jgi:hypothetical protein
MHRNEQPAAYGMQRATCGPMAVWAARSTDRPECCWHSLSSAMATVYDSPAAQSAHKQTVIDGLRKETLFGCKQVGGLIWDLGEMGYFKLLVGAADKLHTIDQDVLTGPSWPNTSSHLMPLTHVRVCGRKPEQGCLFQLRADEYEEHSLAVQNTTLFEAMLARVDRLQEGVYSPKRGPKDKAACTMAQTRYSGYWGPWLRVSGSH